MERCKIDRTEAARANGYASSRVLLVGEGDGAASCGEGFLHGKRQLNVRLVELIRASFHR